MAFDFLNSLASQSFLGENKDVVVDSGDESDIDVEVETSIRSRSIRQRK